MPQRILKGKVVSTKMVKTIVVEVTRLKEHPKYKKRIKVTKKYKAHYDGLGVKLGDDVLIQEARPISKEKQWVVKEVRPSSQGHSTELSRGPQVEGKSKAFDPGSGQGFNGQNSI